MSSYARTAAVAPRLLLGITMTGLIGLSLLVPPGQDARGADRARIAAGFQTTDSLKLTLDVPASNRTKKVSIELVDRKGKVVATKEESLPGGEARQITVKFDNVKLKPAQLTVRCKHDGKSAEAPLDRVLLVRAHETSLSASTEFFAGSEAELACKVHGVRSISETVPLAADVTVTLVDAAKKARQLFAGRTGADGVAKVRFQVPEVPSGGYTLEVHTRSALGEEKLTRAV
jgi:hypothetical protein